MIKIAWIYDRYIICIYVFIYCIVISVCLFVCISDHNSQTPNHFVSNLKTTGTLLERFQAKLGSPSYNINMDHTSFGWIRTRPDHTPLLLQQSEFFPK